MKNILPLVFFSLFWLVCQYTAFSMSIQWNVCFPGFESPLGPNSCMKSRWLFSRSEGEKKPKMTVPFADTKHKKRYITESTARRPMPPAINNLIQVYDSLYYWGWDLSAGQYGTQALERLINIQYDPNYNLLAGTFQMWDGIQWVNNQQFIYSYDTNNNLISEINQVWDGSQWQNNFRQLSTFDFNHNMLSNTRQNWNAVQWVNFDRESNTYNSAGKLLSETIEYWDETPGVWSPAQRTLYNYDSTNKLLTMTEQVWNTTQWINFSLRNYAYNANDSLLSTTFQDWDGVQWINNQLSTCTYDVNQNLLDVTYQNWDGLQWVYGSQVSYTYDVNHNRLSETIQNWIGIQWTNSNRTVWTYDTNNNRLSRTAQFWSISQWVNTERWIWTYDIFNRNIGNRFQDWDGQFWIDEYELNYAYDANGFIFLETDKNYNQSGTVVFAGDSIRYYSHAVTSLMELPADLKSTVVYPNPVQGGCLIITNTSIQQGENMAVAIYDTYGRLIMDEQVIMPGTPIDIRELSDGIYMVRIRINNHYETHRLLVEQ